MRTSHEPSTDFDLASASEPRPRYRALQTLLQNEEFRLLGIIARKKQNIRTVGGDSVPDAGDASHEDEAREEQAHEAEHASDTLKEVLLALVRITAGTFGLCEKGGGDRIDEKRLAAIPWTRYCSAHAAEEATGSTSRRVTL